MDVISLCHHMERPEELLRRRLQAVVGRALDGPPGLFRVGARRSAPAGAELTHDTPSADALLLVSGVAGDVRTLADGRRQILGLRLPGDVLQGDVAECTVALTPVEVADALPLIRALGERDAEHQPLRRAWVAAARAEQAMLRDQVVRLGRLSAYERMAHMLVETHERLRNVGLASATAFHFPVRQDVVADLLGLSVVHLSRTTQQLRRERLAQTRSSYVTLLDRERVAEIGNYVSRFAGPPDVMRFTPAPDAVAGARLASVR